MGTFGFSKGSSAIEEKAWPEPMGPLSPSEAIELSIPVCPNSTDYEALRSGESIVIDCRVLEAMQQSIIDLRRRVIELETKK